MKNSRFRHIFNHAGLAVFTALLFGAIGSYTLLQTHAATSDTLTGNQTITTGNQLVSRSGGVKLKMQTDGNLVLRNWQDTIIWSSNTAGSGGTVFVLQASDGNLVIYTAATNGTAVWAANTGGKGGTKLIVQDDGNLVLYTSSGTPVWHTGTNGKQGTAPPPAPAPTPTPSPTPSPSPSPSPSAPKTTTPKATTPKTTTPTPAPPAAPTVSKAADATITTGSTTATLSIPSGNAGSLYIRYGTDSNNLNRSSDIQTLSGATATIKLDNLNGKTTYTYEIVRTQGTQMATSPQASFTTKGYTLNITFTDASGKPVKGISTQLGNGKPVKSDEDGVVAFKNLGSGSYSPIFEYNGQSYSENFSTSSDGKAAEDGTVVLNKTIDLSKLHQTAQVVTNAEKPQSSSNVGAVLVLILLLALVGGGVWWAIHRKRRLLAEAYGYAPTDYVPPVVVNSPAPQLEPEPTAVVEAVVHHNKTKKQPGQPTPAPVHMGESLRDMVIQSMAEDAVNHPEHHSKKPPIVPGG
ncbi:hypothetical protein EYC59_03110 [Candidatus Saccharibacteria bacterium]|nr:MAG: hypothetical protein EYC59_03110 [Candidatus Saccharibacteria bacterium]